MQRYSGIQAYTGCQQKYKFQYIDKLEGDSSVDLHFGSALHAGLEAYFKLSDSLKAFNNYMSDIPNNATASRYSVEQLTDMGAIFIERFIRLHAKKYNPKFIEKSMQFEVLGHSFHGTADVIGLYEGVPSVVDFKTSGYRYSDRKILSNQQMPLYAHAAKTTLNYPVEQLVYVVFIKSATAPSIQVQKRPITQEEINNSLAEVKIVCDDIVSKEQSGLYLKNRGNCEYCPYFERCAK